jgi:predicted regulator of Ras-like GTPase activity (Roadblock/LC7/MglB family)
MPKKRKGSQVIDTAEPLTVSAASVDDLRAGLEEIKEYEGVIGYILRNAKSAAIDLKDPTKIIDYAVLSSSALDASKELSELFDLGAIRNIVVEGKDVKVLALTSDENKISVFVEKDGDCKKVLKKLHSL